MDSGTKDEHIALLRIVTSFPLLTGVTTGLFTCFFIYKGFQPLGLEVSFFVAASVSCIIALLVGMFTIIVLVPLIKYRVNKQYQQYLKDKEKEKKEIGALKNTKPEEKVKRDISKSKPKEDGQTKHFLHAVGLPTSLTVPPQISKIIDFATSVTRNNQKSSTEAIPKAQITKKHSTSKQQTTSSSQNPNFVEKKAQENENPHQLMTTPRFEAKDNEEIGNPPIMIEENLENDQFEKQNELKDDVVSSDDEIDLDDDENHKKASKNHKNHELKPPSSPDRKLSVSSVAGANEEELGLDAIQILSISSENEDNHISENSKSENGSEPVEKQEKSAKKELKQQTTRQNSLKEGSQNENPNNANHKNISEDFEEDVIDEEGEYIEFPIIVQQSSEAPIQHHEEEDNIVREEVDEAPAGSLVDPIEMFSEIEKERKKEDKEQKIQQKNEENAAKSIKDEEEMIQTLENGESNDEDIEIELEEKEEEVNPNNEQPNSSQNYLQSIAIQISTEADNIRNRKSSIPEPKRKKTFRLIRIHRKKPIMSTESISEFEIRRRIGEKITFNMLVWCTTAGIAIAHGSNVISNAAGPLTAITNAMILRRIPTSSSSVPMWVLFLTTFGLVCGIVINGTRGLFFFFLRKFIKNSSKTHFFF